MKKRVSRPSASRPLSPKESFAEVDKLIRNRLSTYAIEGDQLIELQRRIDYLDVRLQGNFDLLEAKLDTVLRLLRRRDDKRSAAHEDSD